MNPEMIALLNEITEITDFIQDEKEEEALVNLNQFIVKYTVKTFLELYPSMQRYASSGLLATS